MNNIKVKEINSNIDSKMSPLKFDGSLIINGDTLTGSIIIATQDIKINGNVFNSKIRSLNGNVFVKGSIQGVYSFIQAEKDISAAIVNNAKLKSNGNIIIKDLAIDSNILGKKSIYIHEGEGIIEGGYLEAGEEIITNSVGNKKKVETYLKLENYRENDLYSQLIEFHKKEVLLSNELQSLEKFIKVIRLLGEKVIVLPFEKKKELALKVKKYNEIKEKINLINKKKDEIYDLMKQEDELKRVIIVRDYIYEGVVVEIDGVKLKINNKYKRVILYKKGIIIIGNYDEFMQRKKYF